MFFYAALGLLGFWAFTRLFRLGRETAHPNPAPEPIERLRRADRLAQERRYDEALAEYLWCFDQGIERRPETVGAYSFLMTSLDRLASVHPPAREALTRRRDQAELDIHGQTAHPLQALDYASLNHILGDDLRTLAASRRLEQEGPSEQGMGTLLFQSAMHRLLDDRRYGDFLGGCGPVEGYIARAIDAVDATREHPRLREAAVADVVETGAGFFEALLGGGRPEEARRLGDRLIDFHTAGRTYAALVRHAILAARPDISAELARRGKETLPRDQHGEIDAAGRPPQLP